MESSYKDFEEWDAAEEKEMEKERKNSSEKRHKELTPEELQVIEEEKDEINTKKTTKWATVLYCTTNVTTILTDFLCQKQKNTDLNTHSAGVLCLGSVH